ncbi:family 16 glycoside hydrolase [Sandaracinus amylolyticus]|uniref:family 16 glycoside hydrolase n=1 Tax=Sandaracinus amylolyticus TaxID=927083 RepID=UPI001F3F3CB8|nr:family 16 glycoside hydrolase [Sandaracinus amylolyticus]UJR78295.1 Farnesoic acid 0-methyl transferase [Sandaracinus amylolyticus]
MRRLLFLFALALLPSIASCTPQGDPGIGAEGLTDDFEREELGELWHNTGASWRIVDGQLNIRNARNRPLWLRRTLPRDVRIEFDVRSESPDGDIKVEIFGDGSSRATTESYTATSYVVIFGGWSNSMNVLARMDEHGADRVVGARRRVEPGRTYRMRIERRGSRITAWVDDEELVSMDDPRPLEGPGHDHFAFNNWQVELWFDNLRITPL